MTRQIIYIDDIPALPDGTAAALGRLDYRLLHTPAADEGLRLVREGQPELVIVEIMIHGGEGIDLIEQIRRLDGASSRVPVLILTRNERSAELYTRALELGANDYICKPVLRPELIAAVLECTEGDEAAHSVDEEAADRPAVGAISGEFAQEPPPELLWRLHRSGVTGVLLMRGEDGTCGLELRNGTPIAVASKRTRESFEDYLVRTKRISEEVAEDVGDQIAAGLGDPREILVGMGVLEEEALDEAAAQQATDALLEVFGWQNARFRFEPGKTLKASEALNLDHDMTRVVVEGLQRWTPVASLREQLGRRADLYASHAEGAEARLEGLDASFVDSDLLESLSGDRTLGELMDLDDHALRSLLALSVIGCIELHRDAVLVLTEEVSEGGVVSDEAAETGGTHDEVSREAQRVSDRAMEAETWFKKGQIALRRKQYDEALEAFGMASHLDPEQGEYVANTGYALYLSNPSEALVQRESLEQIAKGVKLAPEREQPMLLLARVFKAQGELESARKVFARIRLKFPHTSGMET